MTALTRHSGSTLSGKDASWGSELPAEVISRLSRQDLSALARRLEQRPSGAGPVVRTIHHFACTGGTLISRGLQSQPNTMLLSEVDPLSTIQLKTQRSRFAPTDPVLLARAALNPIGDDTAIDMFLASLDVLSRALHKVGRNLVLRDHAHSQFCTDVDWKARPSLGGMLRGAFPVHSLVTVRHPVDSFLALDRNNWRHFSPFSLDEYARRYTAFLDEYDGVPTIRYERFVSDPDETMREICRHLDLPYNQDWKALISIMKLSGDSGRRGDRISPRPRREYTAELSEEARASLAYRELCDRMGYDASLD